MIRFLLMVIVCTLAGSAIGTLTGLVPGLHVNTVALLLVAGDAVLIGMVNFLGLVPLFQIPLLAAVIITSTSITHTFVDFVPSTFLGVPDPDTALSVLPAHELLLQGQGYKAVHLSAIGSAIAVALGAVIFLPYTWLLGPPLDGYRYLREYTLYLLLFLTAFLLSSEESQIRGSRLLGKVMALTVFVISGILGLVTLPLPSSSSFGLFSTVLFPLFSGLFGLSTLFLSLNESSEDVIPEQRITYPDIGKSEVASAIPGGIAGSVVGFLPGVSSAHASLIAMLPGRKSGGRKRKEGSDSSGKVSNSRREVGENRENGRDSRREVGENREEVSDSRERVIVTMGAVNTSNAIFVLIALFLTGSARSGAAVAIQEFIPSTEWDVLIPYHLSILLIAVFLSSVVAYHITLASGKMASSEINRVPYRKLILGIIVFVCTLVFIFNGFLGLFILMVATCTGILPQVIGVRRSHLMGVLLIPVMLYFW